MRLPFLPAITALVAVLLGPSPAAFNLRAQSARSSTDGAGGASPSFTDIVKIDAHSHVFEDLPAFHDMLRRNNARTINICVPGTDGLLEEMHRIAVDLYRKHPDLYPFVTTFDLRDWSGAGFKDRTIGWLRQAFSDGARGVKIWKEIGLELKRPDGSFLMADDAVFDPIYVFIAQSRKVLVAHLAEPIQAWRPLDPSGPHYDYYSTHPEWHLYNKPGYPSHAAIIAARDRILEKHPTLIVVGAHLGSLEHDLEGLGERFDRYPNFNVDSAGRLRNLSYQSSEKVRRFLIQYQDRIVYGIDMGWRPHRGGPVSEAMRQAYPRRIDARQRMDFAYLSGHGDVNYGGRTVQALDLPRRVLEKIYSENAIRLFQLADTSH